MKFHRNKIFTLIRYKTLLLLITLFSLPYFSQGRCDENRGIQVFEGEIKATKIKAIYVNKPFQMGEGEFVPFINIYIEKFPKIIKCYFRDENYNKLSYCKIDLFSNDGKEKDTTWQIKYENCNLVYYNTKTQEQYKLKLSKEHNSFYVIDSSTTEQFKIKNENIIIDRYNNKTSRHTVWNNEAKWLSKVNLDFNPPIKQDIKYEKSEDLGILEQEDPYNSFQNELYVPLFFTENILVIDNFSDTYMGGVHGLPHQKYINFNLKTGKKIDLEEVIDTTKENLLGLLSYHKNLIYSDENDIKISDPDSISDDYYFTPTGILFTYQPYILAGFAEGFIDILIPYHSFKYLKPDSVVFQDFKLNTISFNNEAYTYLNSFEYTIKQFILAEDNKNLESTLSFFSNQPLQYYTIKNPTKEQLTKSYQSAWELTSFAKNEIKKITKISERTYEVEVEFFFTPANNSEDYKSINSSIIFEFDYVGKIIKTYKSDN